MLLSVQFFALQAFDNYKRRWDPTALFVHLHHPWCLCADSSVISDECCSSFDIRDRNGKISLDLLVCIDVQMRILTKMRLVAFAKLII